MRKISERQILGARGFVQLGQGLAAFVHKHRAAIDEPGVQLYEACARADFLDGIGGFKNAANRDDGQCALQVFGKLLHDLRGAPAQGAP